MAVLNGGGQIEGYLASIARRLRGADAVRVGFLEGATYPNGTPVALVAAVQNFGAPSIGIPPRPFFSNMIVEKSPGWGASMGRILKSTNYDTRKTFELMGEGISGQLRQSIRDTNTPALSPITIARKGFEKALIDSGHMWNSVAYEVSTGGEKTQFIDAGGVGEYGAAIGQGDD